MKIHYPKEKKFTREIKIIEIHLQKKIRDDRKRMSINLRIDKQKLSNRKNTEKSVEKMNRALEIKKDLKNNNHMQQ